MYPLPILPTYMGHFLYTPSDIHDEGKVQFGTLDAADVIGKDFGVLSIPSVMTTPENIESVFTFRGIFGPVVNCDSTGLSVQSRAGRKKITIESYLQRALIDKPKILVALADEIGPNAGNNRRRKAFERTWQWLLNSHQFCSEHKREFADTKLFGVVLNDSSNPTQLQKMTVSTLEKDVDGLILGGWYQGESQEMRQKMIEEVRSTMTEKQRSVPLMVQGIETLDQIKECLSLGVDMIHINYAFRLMKDGFAFCPNIVDDEGNIMQQNNVGTKRPRVDNDETQIEKRRKVQDDAEGKSFRPPSHVDDDVDVAHKESREDVLPSSVAGASVKASAVPDVASINVWNETFRKDIKVLQEGCHCHSCSNRYTRSYVHHLLKSRELLADVLLYQHNQFQVQRLFAHVAQLRKSGKSIAEVASWIEKHF